MSSDDLAGHLLRIRLRATAEGLDDLLARAIKQKCTHENDSHNFLHFSNLNISPGAESKINSLCVFQSPRIGNL
jgi:hypothetical protein